ncbi:uncharacterized protein LOC108603295 isoform X2 [Drosophila busckii]|uniref:uncharacterized protein LOC108603295 isoform X2 n=1 Tax=Drosophila busckii TaxID=30019 RepID=UPI00083F3C93|nr:uncharacterized protein LOC108603295 isoform X2 [Drosophila busckii]
MDSRMLNVFHEDPYEGNFVKYEPEPDFWTKDEMELTQTLNGILPIAPTDEALFSQNEAEEQLQNSKNLLIYSNFVDQQLSDDVNLLNGQVYRAMTGIDDHEHQRQLSALIDSDSGSVADDDDDVHSQGSNSTFRTRTDSSSIGDYESHSSDYDDDDKTSVADADERLMHTDVFAMQEERKSRTLSTNTIYSEADALGLNIDVNNFDLADFITKDDFVDNLCAMRAKPQPAPVAATVAVATKEAPKPIHAAIKSVPKPKASAATTSTSVVISSQRRDSDCDSDSIIDVETVDIDESQWKAKQTKEVDDLCFVDNVKADPSWCPSKIGKRSLTTEKTETTKSATKPKAICLVPNKKQSDLLKRKVGVKTMSTMATGSKCSKALVRKPQESSKGKSQATPKASTTAAAIATGLGLGGKNLALLKHEREAATTTPSVTLPVKRKLNLEEYKQRRCGATAGAPTALKSKPAVTPTASKQVKPLPAKPAQASPHKAAISSIVNSLKFPAKPAEEPATDPITVAKNKVLRMLEMKRAQQLRIIDSRAAAKVPRVTKLPPLKDIVKDTYRMEIEDEPAAAPAAAAAAPSTPSSKLHANYEEIIIVSVSCNTDITIPPYDASLALRSNKTTTPSSRSLLKSSVLLYNMSHSGDAGKDMTNSLIASIQSEVVKQTNCVAMTQTAAVATTAAAGEQKDVQHGEDMIIMHLPKDRQRKPMVSMSTQTELQPEFPLLTLPTARQSRERTRRSYRKRQNKSSGSESSTSVSSLSSSPASYRSRSNSNSLDRLRHLDTTASVAGGSLNGCGYSSRSTHRHRSSVSSSSYSEAGKYERKQRQRRTSYNKRRSKNQKRDAGSSSGSEYSDRERSRSRSPRQRSNSRSRAELNNSNSSNNNRRSFVDRNVSQPAVEERRIVYVGRIEQETTKENLRRKFLQYGSIKQITIHYKENGMKYGFVTFECAQDAFTAIDTSPRDPLINMYDISFGGRRAFCRASYADLDNAGINNYESYVFPKAAAAPPKEDSFEALLLKMKARLNAGKPTPTQATSEAAAAITKETTAAVDCNSNSNNNSSI